MDRVNRCLAGIAGATCCLSTGVHAEPFLIRNQQPMVALFGLPSPLPSRLPAAETTLVAGFVNWSNFAVTESQGDTGFTLDGEVVETRVHVTRSLGERVALHGELAYRHLSEGSLDSLVADWHEVFGLGSGSRVNLPQNQLLLEYHTGSTQVLHVDQSTGGIADVPLAFGYQLRASETSAVATWLSVKVPTGQAADLTGSGAVDVALSIAADRRLAQRWQVFGQADLAWLGDGDALPEAQESFAWSALAGTSWNAWRTLDLTVQLAANSAVLDTGFEELDGAALVLTFGGSYRTAAAWRFDLGVSEDIDADTSPDIVFNLGVRHAF